MKAKTCKKCGITLELTKFSKHLSNKDGRSGSCVSCLEKQRQEKHKLKDGFAVYYLPEEHYVGITNNPTYRMKKHRKNGKSTFQMEIIGIFNNPFDAIILEAEFHRRGYNGFQLRYKNI